MYNPRRFFRRLFRNVSSDAGVVKTLPATPIPNPSRLPQRGVRLRGERGE